MTESTAVAALPQGTNLATNAITSLMETIIAVAKDPSVPIERMNQLLDMQERLMAQSAKEAFNNSFWAMKPELPVIPKNGIVEKSDGKKLYNFAKYEEMDDFLTPIEQKYGFWRTFTSRPTNHPNLTEYVCILHHVNGHTQETALPLMPDAGQNRNVAQAVISSSSYACRGLTKLAYNLKQVGADDDGVRGGMVFISSEQVATIEKLITDTKTDHTQFLQFWQLSAVENIETRDFLRVANALGNKKRLLEKGTAK